MSGLNAAICLMITPASSLNMKHLTKRKLWAKGISLFWQNMQNVPLVVNGELLRGERAAAARAEMQARYSEDGMRRRRAEDGVAEPEEEQEEDSRGQVADWAMSRLSNKMVRVRHTSCRVWSQLKLFVSQFLAKVGVWALLLWLSGEFWLIYMIASCMILVSVL